VRGLTDLERDPERQLKYLDFIDIYAALDDNERAEYQRDYPDEAETMSRFAERFHEKGMQQGIQQGMQRGIHRGEALVLERLLRLNSAPYPTRYSNGSSRPTSRHCSGGPSGSLPPTVSMRFCTEHLSQ